jgi:5'-3' exonuclease
MNLEELEAGGEPASIQLDIDGKVKHPETGKIALIDADTLAYTAVLNTEQQEHLLPWEMYSEDEILEIRANPNYDEDTESIWTLNLDIAYAKALEKLERIFDKTGCREAEMHFTGGRENFRYEVAPNYKANRTGRAPTDLHLLKAKLMENFPGTLSTKYEADDIVVYKAMQEPEKYTMVAVDKDLLFAVPGTHFNYYESAKYQIEMKWMPENDLETSMKWPYLQSIIGDKVDNIEGIHGMGKVAAAKAFAGCTTDKECWEALVLTYESKGKNQVDALTTMRLVHMHQFDGEKIVLWDPRKIV